MNERRIRYPRVWFAVTPGTGLTNVSLDRISVQLLDFAGVIVEATGEHGGTF